MGNITEITEDNVEELRDFLGEDVAENIGREYFYGLACSSPFEETTAAIVWCVRNTESLDDAEAELFYFSSDNEEDGRELINEYSDRIPDDNVTRSFFEFEEIGDKAGSVLEDGGFSMKETEGKNLYGTLEEISGIKQFSNKKTPSYIISLGKLSQLQFRQGITNCMFSGRVGINEDLAMLPLDWYEEDVSCCMMSDEKVNGWSGPCRPDPDHCIPVIGKG